MHAINSESLLTFSIANLADADRPTAGYHPGEWSGSELRVETSSKIFFLETPHGIRGVVAAVIQVTDDGTVIVVENRRANAGW